MSAITSWLTRALMRGVSWRLARVAAAPVGGAREPLPLAVSTARGILVVALAEAGDMVLLSPFLRELRGLAPDARITLVTLPATAILFEHSGVVDRIATFAGEAPRLLRPLLLPRRARRFARRELRGGFDVAIVPRWDTDHRLATAVALYSGAPRRVGFSEQSTPRRRTLNAGFDTLLTDVVESGGAVHEVERHLTMLRALGSERPSGRLALRLSDGDRRRAAELLRPVSGEHVFVALGVGAAHPKRRWPAARFAEVGRALQRELSAHVLVVGGPGDIAEQDAILRELAPGATGLAGRLTLRESTAALGRCALFVGNDSAPLHLAAAAGVPCVEISCHPATGDPLHNNAPERFGPWGVPSAVLRPAEAVPPCDDGCRASRPHCILEVASDEVIRAARALLTTSGERTTDAIASPGSPSREDFTIGDGERSHA